MPLTSRIKKTELGFLFKVKVIPGASKNEIVGWENGALKIRLNAPPEKGKANQALIAFLAKELDISKSSIQIVSGQTSRHKTIHIEDISLSALKMFNDVPS